VYLETGGEDMNMAFDVTTAHKTAIFAGRGSRGGDELPSVVTGEGPRYTNLISRLVSE
jgi:hypothetical protein